MGQVPPPPRDSGEESCSQPALTLTLILSYMYFLQGYSNAPDLQQMPRLSKGFGQTKSLCRFRQGFFSFLDKWSYFFFIWAGCFSFSSSKDSFSVDFSIGVSVKSFHATTEFLSCIKFVMTYWIKICKSHEIRAMMSFCREHFPRSLARWQDYDTFIVY